MFEPEPGTRNPEPERGTGTRDLEPNTEHEPGSENPEARTAVYAFRFEKKCRCT
jgi:hypothetical protein